MAVLLSFNAVSGFATASSLNVAVMSHDTAKERGTLCGCVCVRFCAVVCVWVSENDS